jgi:hypothetical protein
MRKAKSIKFGEFINGDFKARDKERKQRIIRKTTKIASAAILPLATCGAVGTLSFAMTTFASTTNPVPVSVAPIASGRSYSKGMDE